MLTATTGLLGRSTSHLESLAMVSFLMLTKKNDIFIILLADSMNLPEDDLLSLRASLANWVKDVHEDGTEFAYRPNIMSRGDQTGDSISCGIIAYNAVAHDIFADELWSLSQSKRLRIEALNEIVKEQIESVSVEKADYN